MKKYIFILFTVIISLPFLSYGASPLGDRNVKMVTYYPIPSGVYSEVNVGEARFLDKGDKTLQIGSVSSPAKISVEGAVSFGRNALLDYLFIGEDLYPIKITNYGDFYINFYNKPQDPTVEMKIFGALIVKEGPSTFSGKVVSSNGMMDTDFYLQNEAEVAVGVIANFPELVITKKAEGVFSLGEYYIVPDSSDITHDLSTFVKFPRVPTGCTMEWRTWKYKDSKNKLITQKVLALDADCGGSTGGGTGGEIPVGEDPVVTTG